MKRNSSFEVSKIIAILLIILCHSIPTARIDTNSSANNIWMFGILIFKQFGSIGNSLFLVSSAWFLVDDNKPINYIKIKKIIADNQIISVLFLLGLLSLGFEINGYSQLIKQFIPFLTTSLWYISCYIVYYLIHGIINSAIRSTSIGNMSAIMITVCFFAFQFLLGGVLYFSDLIAFIVIHALTYYVKNEYFGLSDDKKIKCSNILIWSGLVGWLLFMFIANTIGNHVAIIGSKFYTWNRFYNPFILMLSYGVVLFSSRKRFYSKSINDLAALSLYVYMITDNQLLRIHVDNKVYDYFISFFGGGRLMGLIILYLFCYMAL